MKWLWKSSVAKNLFVSFLLVLIPLILISLLINNRSVTILNAEITTSYSNSLTFLTKQMDSMLNNFGIISSTLFNDGKVNYLNYDPNESAENMYDYAKLLEQLRSYSGANDLDSNITIFLNNKLISLSSRAGLSMLSEETISSETTINPDSIGRWLLLKQKSGDLLLTYTNKNIYLSPKSIAIKVEINSMQIKSLLKDLQKETKGNAFLLDAENNPIFAEQDSQIDSKVLINKLMSQSDEKGQFTLYHGKTNYRFVYSKSEDTGLILGMYYKEAEIMKPINQIRSFSIIILIFSLVLGLIFSLVTYRNIILPVHTLVDGMKEVKNGNLKIRIAEDKKAELGFMFTQFNKMVKRIDELVNEIYYERIARERAQLKFLQSQINPHFLYNCLNFIYQMSKDENSEASANMSLFLSKYFRFATKSSKDTILLLEEIENIDIYMKIQKMRFPEKFDYSIEISEKIKEMVVPRLIIQPIVENAFVHGLEGSDAHGKILVKGDYVEDNIIIIVEDDGWGITNDRMQEILDKLNSAIDKDNSLGLSNTHWRLKLRYGEDAGISIDKRLPRGTIVTLKIPNVQGENKNV